jgi:hypothetical protein
LCAKQQVWTVTAATDCGPDATCEVTYVWTDDTAAPVFGACPAAAIDLGLNPAALPTEAMAIAAAGTASDTCDKTLVYGAVGGTVTGTCSKQQVWTVTAVTDCGPDATCTVTYVWTVETATLSVGTGYTIQYPPTYSPYELAGPGNWVTVPISVSNLCGDLAQLVFEITFEEYLVGTLECPSDPRRGTTAGLLYMVGTERWDVTRVQDATDWNDWAWNHGTTVPDNTTADPAFDNETRVQVERGVGVGDGLTASMTKLVVYMDSPTGNAVVNAGSGVFMYLMFRVSDAITSFQQIALTPTMIYATNMAGLEVASTVESGVVYADACNWLLDVDRNGRVDPDTDGVTLYRALKYGHLNEAPCSTVPILPPEYAAAAGRYLLSDADIVTYVKSLALSPGLNVDAKTDGISAAIGGTAVSAARDGVYIYGNLRGFPTYIYPVYMGPLPLTAYTPFVNPATPIGPLAVVQYVTVPIAHTNNTPIEITTINPNIDKLKVLVCPPSYVVSPLPCSWQIPPYPGPTAKTLPLPRTVWSCP